MIHLILLCYTLTVILGAMNMVYTYQSYKLLKYKYLHYFFIYTVIFLVSMFTGQILEYIYLIIIGGKFSDVPQTVFYSWNLFQVITRLAILYVIGKTLYETREYRNNYLFSILFLLIAVISLFPSVTMLNPATPNALINIYVNFKMAYVRDIASIVFIGWPLTVNKPAPIKKSYKVLSLFFIFWFALSVIITRTFSPEIGYYINSVLLLPVSIFPYFWIKNYLLKEKCEIQLEKREDLSEILTRDYNISHREWELINLIIQGKSNKEIESILFISHSTVKNHLYNIYQKMKVNSRLQLVSLILGKGNGKSS